jgi:hypothetical protein
MPPQSTPPIHTIHNPIYGSSPHPLQIAGAVPVRVYDWVSSEEVEAPSVGSCSSTASSSISLTSNLFLMGAPLACLEFEFDRRRGLLVVMCSSSKMSSISSPSRPLPPPRQPRNSKADGIGQFNEKGVGRGKRRMNTNFPFLHRLSLLCRERFCG